MEQGRLVEKGNHDDLISQNGRYATLFRQQESSIEARDCLQNQNHVLIY